MADPGLAGRDGANRELKNRLKAALARQGLSQADIVRQTQLNGESVSKAAVSNAVGAEYYIHPGQVSGAGSGLIGSKPG
ncbi:hypothetical protein [Streptomyces antimycoticus]|uniref:hypothetical protein n=1 Tax=Streptomyces antimycoticus TaxID=68175 RepID=UPI0011809953|nr:hypothetical protein [Streptomyces antimycoticus]